MLRSASTSRILKEYGEFGLDSCFSGAISSLGYELLRLATSRLFFLVLPSGDEKLYFPVGIVLLFMICS